jgi:hypothetical protein
MAAHEAEDAETAAVLVRMQALPAGRQLRLHLRGQPLEADVALLSYPLDELTALELRPADMSVTSG